jgi:hypothetical protein
MNNTKTEQIQNEILELGNKIIALQINLDKIQNGESEETAIDFQTMMDWADEYFQQKENIWELTNDLEEAVSVEDICNITLSLSGNEIEIENEWVDTKDIVERVMNAVHNDFKNWMKMEMENHVKNDNNN